MPSHLVSVPDSDPLAPPSGNDRSATILRDSALVARVRAGDERAFDEIVQAYMRQAFQLAFRVVGHREDAEDLLQESFLAAYQYLDTFDAARPFGPWLMRIVSNRGANLRRSRTRRATEPEVESVSQAPSALETSERREMGEQLTAALATLSERQRTIVTLFDVDDMTSAEIGELLGLSAGTVRWHLHEARHTLRDALARVIRSDE